MTGPAARRSRGDQTRERLLDAAEELMAERGVHGPSLAEITARAGQRNNSALSYHFGGRQELLRALAARHQARLTARRAELLAEAEAGGTETDLRALLDVLVRPVVELATGSAADRRAVRVWAGIIADASLDLAAFGGLVSTDTTRTGRRLVEAMAARGVPHRLAVERVVTALESTLHVLATRIAVAVPDPQPSAALPADVVVHNLVDMMAAALVAPVDPVTARLLSDAEAVRAG